MIRERSVLQKLMLLKMASGGSLSEYEAEGNPVSFNTNVAKPLKGFTVPIDDENGITGLNVFHSGTNLWDEEWEVGNLNTSTGENTPSSSNIRSKNYIPINPGMKKLRWVAPINNVVCFYGIDKTYISTTYVASNKDINIPSNAYYLRFYCGSAYGTTYNNDISVNYPNTDTTYHVYSGTSYPVTFPAGAGTVYSGSLDLTTGLLTITQPEIKTVQLDPVAITTLIGDNTIWTDTNGQNTVKYLKRE